MYGFKVKRIVGFEGEFQIISLLMDIFIYIDISDYASVN